MNSPLVLALLSGLVAYSNSSAPRGVGERPSSSMPLASAEQGGAREAAERLLKHMYAVYLGIRGCTEAAMQLGKPEHMPAISLDDARRTMRAVDLAAREAGLDIDRLWSEIAPLGVVTAEALKGGTVANLEQCRTIGSVFRIDLANFQNVIGGLGSSRPLIEKDF